MIGELRVLDKPERCMRCGWRHYTEREKRECGIAALHAAMRHLVEKHYVRSQRQWGWHDKADEEAARLLEQLWKTEMRCNELHLRS